MAKKTIPSLIRIHKWDVDEKRQALAKLLDEQEAVKDARKKQEEQLAKDKRIAATDQLAAMTFGAYLDAYIKKREQLEAEIALLQTKIEEARDVLADAFKELKTYEILQKRHEEEEKKERDNKEQKEIDDMATKQFVRRKAKK